MRKLLGLAFLVLLVYVLAPEDKTPKSTGLSSVKPAAPVIDKSTGTQTQRKQLIEKLIASRIFHKVATPGNAPRVYVLPPFYELDFDTKQQFVSVVYAFYFDGTNELTDLVRVFDARTNKSIGTYTIGTGGLMLD
jgi:hypothetical protein